MRLNSMQKNAVNAFKYYEDMENAYFNVLVRIGKLFFTGNRGRGKRWGLYQSEYKKFTGVQHTKIFRKFQK